MISNTSLKTYLNEIAPTIGARQIRVLEVFEQAGGKDFTNEELARALEWGINRVTPRVKELRDRQILELSCERKCGVTGREVKAWRVTGFPSPSVVRHFAPFYQLPSRSVPGATHVLRDTTAGLKCGCKGFLFRGTCSHIDKLKRQAPRPEETMRSLFA